MTRETLAGRTPASDGTAAPERPLPNTYWVVPGKLLAGEHPAGAGEAETRQRIARLLEAGVECFIDLTHPRELPGYDPLLPFSVEYLRKPIRDHGLPERPEHMAEILECLADGMRSGRPVYVHCRAGIGRTGTVVGCWLVEQGLSGPDALAELNRLWQQCARSVAWPEVPETPAQVDFVRRWRARLAPGQGAEANPPPPTTPANPKPPLELPDSARTGFEFDPLLDPGLLAGMRSLRDRFTGALLGLAIGDSVAVATQFRRPGSFQAVGDLLGGGAFDLPRGGWTDDTAMALCLADSLLACESFDPRDQVSRYQRWQQQGWLSATGECLGITASTARALTLAKVRRQPFCGSHDPAQLDPEPLSRVAPVVLFRYGDPSSAVAEAAEAARSTCQAPGVLEACRALARGLHAALSGENREAVLRALATAGVPSARGAAGNGTAAGALAQACEALQTTESFREAVLRAANYGGNSDVVAAVCGQLAGALYGVGAIPSSWRNALLQRDLIESYADRLLAHAIAGSTA